MADRLQIFEHRVDFAIKNGEIVYSLLKKKRNDDIVIWKKNIFKKESEGFTLERQWEWMIIYLRENMELKDAYITLLKKYDESINEYRYDEDHKTLREFIEPLLEHLRSN